MTLHTKRKILLAVSGLSPQIVTETMYALVTRKDNPWLPDEVHLLSTHDGCERAKAELLHESRDMFGKFCRDYLPDGHVIKFDEQCLHTFTRDGAPLNDIRDLDDGVLVADAIAAKVWELTQDGDTEIHASIAGGRKSMGFLLGYSMSLYGRPQDRLSHVLVNQGFETNQQFYFPPKKSIIIHDRDGKPLNTADAIVSLAEIPILHLRERLPKEWKSKAVSFATLVDVMNFSLIEPSIEIDPFDKTLKCHGIDIKLSPINFSFYFFMAKKYLEDGHFDLNEITFDEFWEIKKFMLLDKKDEELKEEARKQHVNSVTKRQFFDDRKHNIKQVLIDTLGSIGNKYAIKTKRDAYSYLDVDRITIHTLPQLTRLMLSEQA